MAIKNDQNGIPQWDGRKSVEFPVNLHTVLIYSVVLIDREVVETFYTYANIHADMGGTSMCLCILIPASECLHTNTHAGIKSNMILLYVFHLMRFP